MSPEVDALCRESLSRPGTKFRGVEVGHPLPKTDRLRPGPGQGRGRRSEWWSEVCPHCPGRLQCRPPRPADFDFRGEFWRKGSSGSSWGSGGLVLGRGPRQPCSPLAPLKKKKSRRSAALLGPRCGHLPLTGPGDGRAPPRFLFFEGRVTDKHLPLTSPGAAVHSSWGEGPVSPARPSLP